MRWNRWNPTGKMKDRARMVGETSVHTLLASLQQVAREPDATCGST